MVVQINRREADCRCGILSSRFNDEIILVKLRHLISYLICLTLIGYNVYVVCWNKGSEPFYCLLYEGLFPVNTQELFGHGLPAHRPEARAAAAGHDYDVGVIHCHLKTPFQIPPHPPFLKGGTYFPHHQNGGTSFPPL